MEVRCAQNQQNEAEAELLEHVSDFLYFSLVCKSPDLKLNLQGLLFCSKINHVFCSAFSTVCFLFQFVWFLHKNPKELIFSEENCVESHIESCRKSVLLLIFVQQF